MEDAVSLLSAQWLNPSDVSTVLMVIGGDVVRTALAQSTGTLFTPVCFSFGWVSYAFLALITVLGEGRLLPPPDYPVKVINVKSGYTRENKNWVIGRIVRDHETWINKKIRCQGGIRISIFEAQPNPNCWTRFSYDWIHLLGLVMMVVQLAIAAIPIITDRDWVVLLITGGGTFLALIHGALPQWKAEKLPNRQHSHAMYGLTTGNGSKDIMIIKGMGRCLNLEDFAVTDSPRNDRPWEKFLKFSPERGMGTGPLSLYRGTVKYAAEVFGLPLGFWLTLLTTVAHSVLWLLLLICVSAVRQNTWYLLLVGFIGMFQNGIVAAVARPPEARNLPLRLIPGQTINRRKVMDGLMDLEVLHQCGRPFLKEFFPAELQPEEKQWWEGKREVYDEMRLQQEGFRGPPASVATNDSLETSEKHSILPPSPLLPARPVKSALKARSTNQSVTFADSGSSNPAGKSGTSKQDVEAGFNRLSPPSSPTWRISPSWE